MGAVVVAIITSASRWSVKGDVVAWIYPRHMARQSPTIEACMAPLAPRHRPPHSQPSRACADTAPRCELGPVGQDAAALAEALSGPGHQQADATVRQDIDPDAGWRLPDLPAAAAASTASQKSSPAAAGTGVWQLSKGRDLQADIDSESVPSVPQTASDSIQSAHANTEGLNDEPTVSLAGKADIHGGQSADANNAGQLVASASPPGKVSTRVHEGQSPATSRESSHKLRADVGFSDGLGTGSFWHCLLHRRKQSSDLLDSILYLGVVFGLAGVLANGLWTFSCLL